MKRASAAAMVAVGFATAALWSGAAGGATRVNVYPIRVTTTADDFTVNGNCTLREAVEAAMDDKRIDQCRGGLGETEVVLPAGTYPLTIDQLFIGSPVTIVGVGPTSIISGGGRAFTIESGGNLTVKQLVVQNFNQAFWNGGSLTVSNSTIRNNGGGDLAPAILNQGQLAISASTISGNHGVIAGGVDNDTGGVASAVNVTIANNHAVQGPNSWDIAAGAGGIYNLGSFTGRNLTITGNSYTPITIAPNQAGGIVEAGSAFQLANSAVSGNLDIAASDCYGTISSLGYDLMQTTKNCAFTGTFTGLVLGKAAKLGSLANNGGYTFTEVPLAGSPVIDKGNPATPGTAAKLCPSADQRGVVRPRDGNADGTKRCDIGAVEK